MAYTTESRQLIFDLSLRLLQQDMLTNNLFLGGEVGKSLRDLVLQDSRSLKLTDPTAQALSGKLRSDAGMLRQASSNVSEAKSVTDMAQSATEVIRTSLERMQELAEGVSDGTLTVASAQAEYQTLIDTIEGSIDNASYNGFKLLSADGWAGDERVTLNGTAGTLGTTGDIHIQAGDSGFNLALHDISYLKGQFSTADIQDAATAATSATTLSGYVSDIQGIETILKKRSEGLSSHAASLSSQADILTTAATTREASDDKRSVEELLLDYVLTNVGKIVDTDT
ncbi:flagellin [Oleidesulfovibrio sp.]|uniref:flagellin n=1 Tax=Oleidesulfovibrio sp. TaxID=2909707 RepID=UPI003A84EF3B